MTKIMFKSIFTALVLVPLMTVGAYAAQCLLEPPNQAFGYSSEEAYGGGSYLGVDTRDVTSERLGDLKLKDEHGVEVTLVDQDAPAGKAGLKEHDVILTLNGTAVESVEQLRRMIHEIPAGRAVSLGISRDGQPLTIKAQLADRKKTFFYSSNGKNFNYSIPAMPSMPSMPLMPAMPDIDVPVSVVVVHSSTRSGLMVENLTAQLGDFFGSKNGKGVLVRSVEKGSRAEQAGFRAGDVIVKVNGESIQDAGDFSHAVRAKDSTVTVGIIRDKKEQTLTLTLPERKSGEVFEESFDVPEIDAETRISISEAQSELARLQPEITLAVREAQHVSEDARQALCDSQQELHVQQQELQEEIKDRQREMQEEMQDQAQELQDQQREMQQDQLQEQRERIEERRNEIQEQEEIMDVQGNSKI